MKSKSWAAGWGTALVCAMTMVGCGGGGGGPEVTSAAPETVEYLQFYGQSNAGQGSGMAPIESRALATNVRQFTGYGKAAYGDRRVVADELSAFEPAQDPAPGRGQFLATLTGLAVGRQGGQFIVHTDWYGNQPTSKFDAGHMVYDNMLAAVRSARALEQSRARVLRCNWVVWVQGESGPADKAAHVSELRGVIERVRPAVATACGQSEQPTFVIVQTNSHDSPADLIYSTELEDAAGLAQWEVSRSMPGVLMAGPMYQAPMVDDPNDQVHITPAGRMIVAEMLADVKSRGNWKPLQPAAISRDGVTIDIRFDVPAGAIAWDTSWVSPVPHFGFSFRDDSQSASISKVEIVGADTVRVTLSAVPTGSNPTIGYAQGELDVAVDGWSAGRGQLMSPTGRASYFFSLGHRVPATINHYAVKFRLGVP